MEDSKMTCLDILLAIILPPLVAYRKFGCKVEFFICILLTLLGWIPGILYAFWALTSSPNGLPFLWWAYKGPI
ncbi:hypothetical protein EJD97_002168 [Solanum chilense]|uniref:Uncharacterized protein n=1 Tax=Solanum chilense TaxID=4083 RepID=A0A6N2CK75_SOLCI|nr:hypothetical protein EJD97_002168 [Solanum chilense]